MTELTAQNRYRGISLPITQNYHDVCTTWTQYAAQATINYSNLVPPFTETTLMSGADVKPNVTLLYKL